MNRPWTSLPAHRTWLAAHARRQASFASAAEHPTSGFAWLDDQGRPDPKQGVHTWITCRMTHVFALEHLRGIPGAGPLADHGVRALSVPRGGEDAGDTGLRDTVHDGWYGSLSADGAPGDTRKSAYEHAFVLLAASSAATAGRHGARELLDDAISVVERYFWDAGEERCAESWDRAWSVPEDYRGANSNMHMVEAFLAVGAATGDPVWAERALGIARFFVHEIAAERDWRLPEHYSAGWEPLPDYNSDQRAHPFRPYGVTVGHMLEWARLLVHLETALPTPPSWLLHDAEAMFEAAVRRGWSVDGGEGFVYTLDWNDRPVVRERMHWVIAEAIAAAAVLHARTGERRYEDWYRTWWDLADRRFADRSAGAWRHELDPEGRPSATVWSGRPDIYHAYQAALLPLAPIRSSLAAGLAKGE
ncbi:AGE family epimerase/isomerase [Marinactinospora endophytica]